MSLLLTLTLFFWTRVAAKHLIDGCLLVGHFHKMLSTVWNPLVLLRFLFSALVHTDLEIVQRWYMAIFQTNKNIQDELTDYNEENKLFLIKRSVL